MSLTASLDNASLKGLSNFTLSFGISPQNFLPTSLRVKGGSPSARFCLYTALANSDGIARLKQTVANVLAPWSVKLYADVHEQLARIVMQACDKDGDGQLSEDEMRKSSTIVNWKRVADNEDLEYMKWLFPGGSHGAEVTETMLPIVLNGYHLADVACKLGNKADVEKLGIRCNIFEKVKVAKNGELDIEVWPILNSSATLTDLKTSGDIYCKHGWHGYTKVSGEEIETLDKAAVQEATRHTNLVRHVSGFFLLLTALVMNVGVLALLCG